MTEPSWNFADLFDAIASSRPLALAVEDAGRSFTWAEHEQRAEALGRAFVSAGASPGAAVAVCLRNCAQFLEAYYGAMKTGLTPVNVNYRYAADEIAYVLADCNAEIVVVAAEFLPVIRQVAARMTGVRRWFVVGVPEEGREEDEMLASPFVPYEQALAAGRGLPPAGLQRPGTDVVLIYTGGTTGMPKGVMWAQTQLFDALVSSANKAMDLPPVRSIADLLAAIKDPAPRGLAASPLMHSTGLLNQWMTLLSGGTAVIYRAARFDATDLLGLLAERRVTSMAIVGDAFARPLLSALDERGREFELSALTLIVSSGAMFSQDVKAGLLRHLPHVTIYDAFGSSEGFGLGVSVSTADTVLQTAMFRLGPSVRVLRDDGTWVGEGEAAVGRVAVCGPLPEGYRGDPDRSARTWPVIEGVRYSISGDYVDVHPDGSLTLLGRGSLCINTGGEKVFPEEVEEALKEHRDIADAACVGVPDARLGSAVCAVVVFAPGAVRSADAVVTQAKGRLAAYKAPRRVLAVDEIPRTALGKVDYPAVEDMVRGLLAAGCTLRSRHAQSRVIE